MRERFDLPGDAFQINGIYPEDEIPGYRTLSASGRETLEKEITTEDTKRDGTSILYTRFKEREIEVAYVINAASFDDFLLKYRNLTGLLNKEDAKIIFNNEPDKYLIGSIIFDSEITKEQHSRSGMFKIICHDPFKYAIEKKTVTFENRTATVNYEGTYKAYPVLTAAFPETLDDDGNNTETSEYGYFGFANQRENILQFGNPEELDYEDITYKTASVINNTFKSFRKWSHSNSSALSRSDYAETGGVSVNTKGQIYASSFGSGSKWHGPSVYMTIPTAADGNAGSKNFKWTINHQFKNAKKKQYGGFMAFVLDTTTSPATSVAGVFITKTSSDNNCMIYGYAGSYSNFKNVKVACSKISTTTITKEGSKITISCGGKTLSTSPAGLDTKEGYQVVFSFCQNGTKTKLSTNLVTKCLFERTNCTYRKEIENTFQPGMVVTADTKDGSIYLGDEDAASLGALGNDWEEFYLTEGTNTFMADFTGWNGESEPTEPTFTITYQERFL